MLIASQKRRTWHSDMAALVSPVLMSEYLITRAGNIFRLKINFQIRALCIFFITYPLLKFQVAGKISLFWKLHRCHIKKCTV